jgi:hypothetical protein
MLALVLLSYRLWGRIAMGEWGFQPKKENLFVEKRGLL